MKRLLTSFVRIVQDPLPAPPAKAGRDGGDLARPPEEQALREAEGERPKARGPTPIAVLVAHGMGQQVPFQTLDEVVTALRAAQVRAGLAPAPVAVRQIQRGTTRIARAETTLRGADGRGQDVHLYEAYWAPLTEGQISLRETVGFLIGAGWAGARRAVAGSWWRMMFGHKQEYALSQRTLWAFVAALAVLLSLVLMNGVIVAATVNRILTASSPGWPGGPLLADLTADFGLCLVLVAGLSWVGVWRVNRRRIVQPDDRVKTPSPRQVGFAWTCVRGTVGVVIATGLLVGYHLLRHYHGTSPRMWAGTWMDFFVRTLERPHASRWQVGLVVLVWGVLAGASGFARWFIREYVGDVAIYVSSHTVNRFYKTRQEIQGVANGIARFIYQERDGAGHLRYDEVIAVGHSLGSVIVYDAVNAMIREDNTQGKPLRVVERTPLLITSGSPLDKTAFIFRNQSKREGDIREGLAQSMQPMISDYATRPKRWVNLWSPNDWICGSLEYYDDGSRPKDDPQNVDNLEDAQATTPLLAHNQYWDGERFGDLLYRALVRAPAPPP